jgi:hypothetical protein
MKTIKLNLAALRVDSLEMPASAPAFLVTTSDTCPTRCDTEYDCSTDCSLDLCSKPC